MNDADFEWDGAKAAQNYIDHGVTFDFVRKLMKNPKELEILGDGSQARSFLFIEQINP